MKQETISSSIYNLLIVSSELAAILAIVLIAIIIICTRKRKQKKSRTDTFLEEIKGSEASREKELQGKLEQIQGLDEDTKTKLIESLLMSEKKVYLHVAQLYMGYKDDSLNEIQDEIKNVSNYYSGVIEQVANSSAAASDDDDAAVRDLKKQVTTLREEKKTLKEKNGQLQVDFDAAMDSMERMTVEFANMYEGGSKEGEQRVKNEMYQLQQTLAKKKEVTDASADDDSAADEVPDLDVSNGSDDGAAAK